MSVAAVHREVSKQTHAINKSEVYSHYLGLLFRRILALMCHRGGGGIGEQRHNRDKQSKDAIKNKGKFREKKSRGSKGGQLASKKWGHSKSSFRSNCLGQSWCHLDFGSWSDCIYSLLYWVIRLQLQRLTSQQNQNKHREATSHLLREEK